MKDDDHFRISELHFWTDSVSCSVFGCKFFWLAVHIINFWPNPHITSFPWHELRSYAIVSCSRATSWPRAFRSYGPPAAFCAFLDTSITPRNSHPNFHISPIYLTLRMHNLKHFLNHPFQSRANINFCMVTTRSWPLYSPLNLCYRRLGTP